MVGSLENTLNPRHNIKLQISDLQIMLCGVILFFKEFFVNLWIKFVKFSSVKIFVFGETMRFLFRLQAQQYAYILLQKSAKLHTFSIIWIAFWPQTPNGGDYCAPPYPPVVETTH